MSEPFDRAQLYALAKKVLIWGVFFTVLYLLRDLFALVFFTFILAFVATRVSEYAVEHLDVSRRFALSTTYILLVLAIFGLGYLLVPRVFAEARQFARDLPALETKMKETINSLETRYAEFGPILNTYAAPERVEEGMKRFSEAVVKHVPALIEGFLNGLMTVVLSILFSFLIVLDLARLRRDVDRLRATRFSEFFQETGKPIVVFAKIVGQAFEAQAFIAVINTLLTVVGMLVLGVPKVALLGIVVFLCSFVPVLGVLISSVPIVLVALNASGFGLAVVSVVMVFLVHTLEAYVINPRVYAHHMKMNPVLVLIVLFLGHHAFGIWGVLLAVPVTHYFITHVAGVLPVPTRRSRRGCGGPDESEFEAVYDGSDSTPSPTTPCPATAVPATPVPSTPSPVGSRGAARGPGSK